jgi:hypothetical protein
MATRTITLSNRPPVKINDEEWEVVASASSNWHDGQVECQANRRSKRSLVVRQKGDRAIVYATYSYSSNWADDQGASCKRGVLVSGITADDQLVGHIFSVADCMDETHCKDGDQSTWHQIAQECIADLPAEELT